MNVSHFCASCTRTLEAKRPSETRATLRAELGQTCTRNETTKHICPMRGERAPAVPTLADFEIA